MQHVIHIWYFCQPIKFSPTLRWIIFCTRTLESVTNVINRAFVKILQNYKSRVLDGTNSRYSRVRAWIIGERDRGYSSSRIFAEDWWKNERKERKRKSEHSFHSNRSPRKPRHEISILSPPSYIVPLFVPLFLYSDPTRLKYRRKARIYLTIYCDIIAAKRSDGV